MGAAEAAGARPPRLMPAWLVKLGGTKMELASRSHRMSNAALKAAAGWSPKWPRAREGLADAARF